MAASSLSAMHETRPSPGLGRSTVADFTRRPPPTTVTPAYNLFRYRSAPDLLCAVPEERPIPSFLDGSVWTYAGALRDGDVPPAGFLRAEADLAARLNGFYLVHTAGRRAGGAATAAREPAPLRV